MRSSSTAAFYKHRSCPSAEVLLLYIETGLAVEKHRRVAAHLATCDFCGAEMQLLASHNSDQVETDETLVAEMPRHLRRLAEDLMAAPAFALVRIVELVYDRERLTLTDA